MSKKCPLCDKEMYRINTSHAAWLDVECSTSDHRLIYYDPPIKFTPIDCYVEYKGYMANIEPTATNFYKINDDRLLISISRRLSPQEVVEHMNNLMLV